MRKFWKVLMIILDIIVVGILIFGLIYAAKWIGSHNMYDAADIFGGM